MGWDLRKQPQIDTQRGRPRKERDPQEIQVPDMNVGDVFQDTSIQNISIARKLDFAKPQHERQEHRLREDELFSHLRHYLSLVDSLLNEVDEIQRDIRSDSRDRVKADIWQTYEREWKNIYTQNQALWVSMAAGPLARFVHDESLQERLQQHH